MKNNRVLSAILAVMMFAAVLSLPKTAKASYSYEEELAIYEEEKRLYDAAMEQYETDLAEYNTAMEQYVIDKFEYDFAVAQYGNDKDAYDRAYKQYLSDVDEYEKALYNYLEKLEAWQELQKGIEDGTTDALTVTTEKNVRAADYGYKNGQNINGSINITVATGIQVIRDKNSDFMLNVYENATRGTLIILAIHNGQSRADVFTVEINGAGMYQLYMITQSNTNGVWIGSWNPDELQRPVAPEWEPVLPYEPIAPGIAEPELPIPPDHPGSAPIIPTQPTQPTTSEDTTEETTTEEPTEFTTTEESAPTIPTTTEETVTSTTEEITTTESVTTAEEPITTIAITTAPTITPTATTEPATTSVYIPPPATTAVTTTITASPTIPTTASTTQPATTEIVLTLPDDTDYVDDELINLEENATVPLGDGMFAEHDENEKENEEDVWHIFDEDGTPLGTVTLPDDVDIGDYDVQENLPPLMDISETETEDEPTETETSAILEATQPTNITETEPNISSENDYKNPKTNDGLYSGLTLLIISVAGAFIFGKKTRKA